MALITLPTKFSFTKIGKWGLTRAGNQLRSRYTGQGQRIVYPYAVWELEGSLVDYDGPEAADIRAFLVDLEGIKHTFRMPVPGYTRPQSGYTGNALVAGAHGARVSSIVMQSNPAVYGQGFISRGDYFTVGDELKMATASVATDAFGKATVPFKPATRKPLADGAVITLQNPYCLMHAVEDDVASWGLTAPVRHGLAIAAIEAVEI